MKNSHRLALAFVVLAGFSAASFADPVPWTVPAGSTATWDYSSGQTLNGAFGSGVGLPDGFALFPDSLLADGSNGSSGSASDTTSVILTAKPNYMFSSISAALLGDYSILGSGNVSSTAQLKVQNLDTMELQTIDLTFTPNMPVSTGQSTEGTFTALADLALPAGWSNIKLSLDGGVSAFGDRGSTSYIEVKTGGIGVQTAVIPLPAAAFAAPVGLYMAYRARRKLMRK